MIEYKDGIHLKGTGLWFDAKKKTELSFVSSADIDKFTAPEKIIATPETIKLLGNKIRKSVPLICPYNRPFSLGSLKVELIPSGYMLGSAQLVVDKGGKTLIYSGDINRENSPTAKPLSIRSCDVLVLKCNSGPDSELPTLKESLKMLTKFIDENFSLNKTPVLLINPLGPGQDIIKSLGDLGYKLVLHSLIRQITDVYKSYKIDYGDYEPVKVSNIEDRVLIFPYQQINSPEITGLKSSRKAIIMACAEEEESIEQNTYDTFAFTGKALYQQLLEYVDKVKPGKVYLIDKYAGEIAKNLEHKGYETVVLEKPTQLNLL